MVRKEFGKTKSGAAAYLYVFSNSSGMKMAVSDLGATLVSLEVKDRQGELRDLVLGYDCAEDYEAGTYYIGACVGRNSNRIGGASFEINGRSYELYKNDGDNNLHSGPDDYTKRIWAAEEIKDDSITFSLVSPHMDQGFPGNVKIYVTYTLTEDCEVQIEYRAVPDADTIINMTNHSYFNMDGHDSGSVLDQKVWINADEYTRINSSLIPTGELIPVEGTPMDFRSLKAIGQDIDTDYEAIALGLGYDHNYALNGDGYRKAASMESDKTGIRMSVYTDMPGMQFYSGNMLGEAKGKGNAIYRKRSAACFETQFFPDAVNHKNFKSPICRKGDTYYSRTAYRFEILN